MEAATENTTEVCELSFDRPAGDTLLVQLTGNWTIEQTLPSDAEVQSQVESDPGIKTAKMIQILDTYEIVFSHGPYLAGVREAADRQPAQELAMQLFNRIKAANNEERP